MKRVPAVAAVLVAVALAVVTVREALRRFELSEAGLSGKGLDGHASCCCQALPDLDDADFERNFGWTP